MKHIKIWMAAALALSLSLTLLSGCGSKQEEPPVTLPNPLVEVTQEELLDAVGLSLTPPEGSGEVRYFTISAPDATIGQMDFSYQGIQYTYRVQATAETQAYDLSGLFYENWELSAGEVAHCAAVVQTRQDAATVYWLDVVPGINYCLSCAAGCSAQELLSLAQQIFTPVQGEVQGDAPESKIDYEGRYVDGDESQGANSVEIAPAGMGIYQLEIGIYRLSTFTGEGQVVDGVMEFTLQDPNGGELYGKFFPAEDGTFTLSFTSSTWGLLESGTTFVGFVKAQ